MNELILPLVSETDAQLRSTPSDFDFDNPQYDPEKLAEQLEENMVYYRGIGLSANQIGLPVKVFSFFTANGPQVAFNPIIKGYSEESTYIREGCLSFPHLFFPVERSLSVTVAYQDKKGDLFGGTFSDLPARIYQHEMEHMDGDLFIDNVSDFIYNNALRKRKMLLRKLKRKQPKG